MRLGTLWKLDDECKFSIRPQFTNTLRKILWYSLLHSMHTGEMLPPVGQDEAEKTKHLPGTFIPGGEGKTAARKRSDCSRRPAGAWPWCSGRSPSLRWSELLFRCQSDSKLEQPCQLIMENNNPRENLLLIYTKGMPQTSFTSGITTQLWET